MGSDADTQTFLEARLVVRGVRERRAFARACRAGEGEAFVRDTAARADPAARALAARQRFQIDTLGVVLLAPWQLPSAFQELGDPPVALFVRGDASLLSTKAMAVVGSRNASAAGVAWATEAVRDCAARQLTVVSGGALGIDAAAHTAALDCGLPTVAYLGVAADRTYPAANRPLFRRILAAGGAIVSEHAPGETTAAYDHAKRNRLIVAASKLLCVAEADPRSGTMGTVRYAEALGISIRVPSPEAVQRHGGVRILIRDGVATPWMPPSSLYECEAGVLAFDSNPSAPMSVDGFSSGRIAQR